MTPSNTSEAARPRKESEGHASPAPQEGERVKARVSPAALKIINAEEVGMLVKLIWARVREDKTNNLFTFTRLGLCAVREGDELTILTIAEQKEALGAKE